MGKSRLTNEIISFLEKNASNLTAKECSEYLHCSESNIRNYCKKIKFAIKKWN